MFFMIIRAAAAAWRRIRWVAMLLDIVKRLLTMAAPRNAGGAEEKPAPARPPVATRLA
jgi:hypothetical protein